jgi:hypothetical protein
MASNNDLKLPLLSACTFWLAQFFFFNAVSFFFLSLFPTFFLSFFTFSYSFVSYIWSISALCQTCISLLTAVVPYFPLCSTFWSFDSHPRQVWVSENTRKRLIFLVWCDNAKTYNLHSQGQWWILQVFETTEVALFLSTPVVKSTAPRG